jgi:hypothetical protein
LECEYFNPRAILGELLGTAKPNSDAAGAVGVRAQHCIGVKEVDEFLRGLAD